MVYSTRKVIDWDVGDKLFGGNHQTAMEMLEQLCLQLPQFKQQLSAAWQQQDLIGLQHIAHKLYGGCCYCPTPLLKEAAKNLENILNQNADGRIIGEAYSTLCQEIEAVLTAKSIEKCCS